MRVPEKTTDKKLLIKYVMVSALLLTKKPDNQKNTNKVTDKIS